MQCFCPAVQVAVALVLLAGATLFTRSLANLRRTVPAGVLVLSGHGLPFEGLHLRIDELIAHHAARLIHVHASVKG